jgi:hypothetical protein
MTDISLTNPLLSACVMSCGAFAFFFCTRLKFSSDMERGV